MPGRRGARSSRVARRHRRDRAAHRDRAQRAGDEGEQRPRPAADRRRGGAARPGRCRTGARRRCRCWPRSWCSPSGSRRSRSTRSASTCASINSSCPAPSPSTSGTAGAAGRAGPLVAGRRAAAARFPRHRPGASVGMARAGGRVHGADGPAGIHLRRGAAPSGDPRPADRHGAADRRRPVADLGRSLAPTSDGGGDARGHLARAGRAAVSPLRASDDPDPDRRRRRRHVPVAGRRQRGARGRGCGAGGRDDHGGPVRARRHRGLPEPHVRGPRIEPRLERGTLVEQAPDGCVRRRSHRPVHRRQQRRLSDARLLARGDPGKVDRRPDLARGAAIGWHRCESRCSSGETLVFEWTLRRKDGSHMSAEISAKIFPDGRWQGLVRDISERKRLEQELRVAEAEQKFLAELGSALVSTIDDRETAEIVARRVAAEIADGCSIETLEEDGQLHDKVVVHRDPAKAAACRTLEEAKIDTSRPYVGSAVRSTRQSLIRDVTPGYLDTIAQSDEARRALHELDPKSFMGVPLLAHGGVVGSLVFISTTASRRFTAHDVPFAQAVATRAALAVEKARLYRIAQHAIQLRDDVLSIVAHDLRNPLGTILMQAAMLRRKRWGAGAPVAEAGRGDRTGRDADESSDPGSARRRAHGGRPSHDRAGARVRGPDHRRRHPGPGAAGRFRVAGAAAAGRARAARAVGRPQPACSRSSRTWSATRSSSPSPAAGSRWARRPARGTSCSGWRTPASASPTNTCRACSSGCGRRARRGNMAPASACRSSRASSRPTGAASGSRPSWAPAAPSSSRSRRRPPRKAGDRSRAGAAGRVTRRHESRFAALTPRRRTPAGTRSPSRAAAGARPDPSAEYASSSISWLAAWCSL